MVNLDATTPQLKVLKQWADAHHSRDLNDAAPIFSKDFTLKMFPKSAVFPDLTREEYLQKYTVAFSLFTNVDVVFHEVIEAPGKIVAQLTLLFTMADGTTVEYDSVDILSMVEEDGVVKVGDVKDFSDPEKRDKFHAEAAKLMGMAVA